MINILLSQDHLDSVLRKSVPGISQNTMKITLSRM